MYVCMYSTVVQCPRSIERKKKKKEIPIIILNSIEPGPCGGGLHVGLRLAGWLCWLEKPCIKYLVTT